MVRPGFVWLAGIRDLQWRRRRFVIAVMGTSLVFALTLLLTGFLANFSLEVNHVADTIGADGFMVQSDRPGPYTGANPLPAELATEIAKLPGVRSANAVVSALQVIGREKRPDVYVVGAPPGTLGTPKPQHGRLFRAPREAVVDTRIHIPLGGQFRIGGQVFKIVGTVSGKTILGGNPVVFMSLTDAQAALFRGLPIATSIAVTGAPTVVPSGLHFVSAKAAKSDLRRLNQDVTESIGMFRMLLWIVATAIVGSVIYLSALERMGDFAVFKATGTSTSDLLGALVVQAVLLSLTGSVLAIGVAYLLAPMFPAPVSFPAQIQLLVPLVAFAIGVVASGAALRRAVTVDPALAFGGH